MKRKQSSSAPDRTCPYCEALVPEDTTTCPGCGENVAALLHLSYAHVIYYNEALALAQQGEVERAHESLLLSLRLQPTYPPALKLMARLAAQQGRWDEARAYTARAKALTPEDAELDALFAAIDEAEAEARQRRAASATPQPQAEPQGAAPMWRRRILPTLLLGAALGSALTELARWLLSRPATRER